MTSEYIKPSVYWRIYKYLTYENGLVLRLSLATGLRVGDCCKVRCEDIKGDKLRYIAEKTGKAGEKTIARELAVELLRNGGNDGFVFKGRLDPDKHRTRQAVWRDVTRACKAAGLPEHVTPHSARKTYAVDVYHQKGLQAAQEELQHDRTGTTLIYALSDHSAPIGAALGLSGEDIKAIENAVQNGVYAALKKFAFDIFGKVKQE
jgi:integrase